MNILFVCTGNTCRSPMAEGIFKHMLKENGIESVNVSSAGISAFPGESANEKAIAVLNDKGIDITNHKARQLSDDIINTDLILTMTLGHKKIIEDYFKMTGEPSPCHTLKEFAAQISDERLIDTDIDDPYGRSITEYKKVKDEIENELIKILKNIHKIGGIEGIMKLVIASDHGGFELKEAIKKHLTIKGINITDIGAYDINSVDYPDYGEKAAKIVADKEAEKGIVVCGTGIGISIAANKVKGIRCALCTNEYMAKMSRLHNNANMLALGGRVTGIGLALDIVDVWLSTEFEGGRHEGRVNKITEIEKTKKGE